MDLKNKKFLLVRNDKIGDFMLIWPAISYLKKNLGNCHITCLVSKDVERLAGKCNNIDEIITDQDKAGPLFFIDKENKYFTNLSGAEYEANTFYDPTTSGGESGVNTSTFNVQGLGEIVAVTGDTEQTQFTLTIG